jgi:hypothetical protein
MSKSTGKTATSEVTEKEIAKANKLCERLAKFEAKLAAKAEASTAHREAHGEVCEARKAIMRVFCKLDIASRRERRTAARRTTAHVNRA